MGEETFDMAEETRGTRAQASPQHGLAVHAITHFRAYIPTILVQTHLMVSVAELVVARAREDRQRAPAVGVSLAVQARLPFRIAAEIR